MRRDSGSQPCYLCLEIHDLAYAMSLIKKRFRREEASLSLTGLDSAVFTFFCNRRPIVHFFSNNVSYFVVVAASNTFSSRPDSALSIAAASGRLFADKYAMMDLFLGNECLTLVSTWLLPLPHPASMHQRAQLFRLPVR